MCRVSRAAPKVVMGSGRFRASESQSRAYELAGRPEQSVGILAGLCYAPHRR